MGSGIPEYVLFEWSKLCKCCSQCGSVPCAGVCAGGVCDKMPCRCDDTEAEYYPPEDEYFDEEGN